MNKHKPKGRIRKKPHPLERPVIRMMYQTDSVKMNLESLHNRHYAKEQREKRQETFYLFTALTVFIGFSIAYLLLSM